MVLGYSQHPTIALLTFAVGVYELYTGGRDGVIKVIDTRTQRIRGELRGHADWVSKLAVFNEGRKQWVLSSPHDGTVKQWNPERLACVNTFNVHRGAINDMTMTSTGTVVTAGADMDVKSFTPKVGRHTISSRIYSGHRDEVHCVEALCGGFVASGGADGKVFVWEMSGNTPTGQRSGGGGTLQESFSLSERKVTSLSAYGKTLFVCFMRF